MLTILINVTLIWLGSLLIYEIALRQTTFHGLNRAYLLLTFLLGIVLPLLPWVGAIEIRELAASATTAAAAAPVPEALPAVPPTGAGEPAAINWLLPLYLCGAAVSLAGLLRELVRIARLYRDARRSRDGRWTIAETGATHGPFSFLNIIFVSNREDYSEAQWRMLRRHEEQHFRSGHFADLILLQAAAVLLWFHPLVYLYRSRLRLLHEYEVDSLREADTLSYGTFLLEQAACRPMAMTHALNYSPLKNRIQMMTKHASSRRARARFLLLLPLMSCAIWCCTKTQSKVGIDVRDRYAMRQDARLAFPKQPPADTIRTVDPVSGKEQLMVMNIEPKPESLNGQSIATRSALSKVPECKNPGNNFGARYVIEKSGVIPTLEKMPDGDYFMAFSDIIIDQQGRIAYYMITLPENHGALTPGPGGINYAKPNGLDNAQKADIRRRIASTLIGGDIAFTPGTDASGNSVPYYLDAEPVDPGYRLSARFRVSNHKLGYTE